MRALQQATVFAAAAKKSAPRLVIVDQLEEVFADAHTDAVARMLRELVASPSVAVVLGVRSDFFHQLIANLRLVTDAQHDNVIVVGSLTVPEVTSCISAPPVAPG